MKKIILFSLVAVSTTAFSQRVKLRKGSIEALRGQQFINVEFRYDKNRVGKFPHERDFIAKKKAEYNSDQPGKGDQWEQDWFDARKKYYEPKFIELFTKETGMSIKSDAPYTLIFSTSYTEPGFNVHVARRNAYVSGVILIADTNDKQKVIAILTVVAPGRDAAGFDFAYTQRVQEAYAAAGKYLGKFLAKANK